MRIARHWGFGPHSMSRLLGTAGRARFTAHFWSSLATDQHDEVRARRRAAGHEEGSARLDGWAQEARRVTGCGAASAMTRRAGGIPGRYTAQLDARPATWRRSLEGPAGAGQTLVYLQRLCKERRFALAPI